MRGQGQGQGHVTTVRDCLRRRRPCGPSAGRVAASRRDAGVLAVVLGFGVGLVCLAVAPALGSEHEGNRAQLVGWSKDGRTWAVLSTGTDERIEVYRAGALALTLCTGGEPDSDCRNSSKQKSIDVGGTETLSGMQRVDVEKHKFLVPYHLERLRPSRRRDFKKRYRLEATGKRKGPDGKRCAAGWRLVSAADATVLHVHKEKAGCVRARGGYLHRSGRFVLVKHQHSGEDYDEDTGYSTYEFESYVLVAVPGA